MDDASAMGECQCIAHFDEDLKIGVEIFSGSMGQRGFIEDGTERASLNQLHGKIEVAVFIDPQLVYGDDVGVAQLRGDLGFLYQPTAPVPGILLVLEKLFLGDISKQIGIKCFFDSPGAPLSDDLTGDESLRQFAHRLRELNTDEMVIFPLCLRPRL